MKEHIDEMARIIGAAIEFDELDFGMAEKTEIIAEKAAKKFYNAGYRKQNDEELIDKIATYFEKEDNWTKLKYAWNGCGKSVQLRDMLRDAICGAKMKGGTE